THTKVSLDRALYLTSENGHDRIAKRLLEAGADPHAQRGQADNELALHAASTGSSLSHQRIVEMLVHSGVDVNIKAGRYGYAALQAAFFCGGMPTIQVLVDSGAEIDAVGGIYGTALHAALSAGHNDIAVFLLVAGANPNGPNRDIAYHASRMTPLYLASWKGLEQAVECLIKAGAAISNNRNIEYRNALYAATGNYDVDALDIQRNSQELRGRIAKLLLDAGADSNALGGYYGKALQHASLRGQDHIVKQLISSGANVSEEVRRYGNGLQAAASGDHIDIVKMLLNAGADVKAKGGYHGSALHAACWDGYNLVVKLLVNNGADVGGQAIFRGKCPSQDEEKPCTPL
ncbi:unnamed protein product, partial [Clonostachys rosea]